VHESQLNLECRIWSRSDMRSEASSVSITLDTRLTENVIASLFTDVEDPRRARNSNELSFTHIERAKKKKEERNEPTERSRIQHRRHSCGPRLQLLTPRMHRYRPHCAVHNSWNVLLIPPAIATTENMRSSFSVLRRITTSNSGS